MTEPMFCDRCGRTEKRYSHFSTSGRKYPDSCCRSCRSEYNNARKPPRHTDRPVHDDGSRETWLQQAQRWNREHPTKCDYVHRQLFAVLKGAE